MKKFLKTIMLLACIAALSSCNGVDVSENDYIIETETDNIITDSVSEQPNVDYSDTKNMGLIINTAGVFDGYTLFTPRHYNTTYLIDNNGELVHSWASEYRVEHAELLENGLLMRGVETVTEFYDGLPMIHERIEMVDADGTVVWFYEYVSETAVLHHDFIMMPNGNLLLSAYDVITRSEAVANGREPDTLRTDVLADSLLEIKPDYENGGGEIVWEWHVIDHIVQDFNEDKQNYGVISENPHLFDFNYFRENRIGGVSRDWNHVSGIDYNEELDLIVLCFHINDEIIVIDHSTTTYEASGSSGGTYGIGGDILYRFGNTLAYDTGKYIYKHFSALHDVTWISNNEIMVINNNYGGEQSTLEIITIPTDFDTSKSAEVEVIYDDFQTNNMGGGQILPNGNTMVYESVKGSILEINAEKEVVWQYIIPVCADGPMTQGQEIPASNAGDLYNEYFTAYRYSEDFLGLDDIDLTPKGIIEQ